MSSFENKQERIKITRTKQRVMLPASAKMKEKENQTEELKFYSQKSIGLATFLGAPLAAGYLIRENYLSLNKPDEAKKSLVIGIISTVILFAGIFMIPESLMDKFPNQILPAIYTGIIYLIVGKTQGKILNQHEENGNQFYSGWRAAGIGLVSLVAILIAVLGVISVSSSETEYDVILTEFTKNENETLMFYDHINTEPRNSLLHELDNNVIPKWEKNIQLILKSNLIGNLSNELVEQNKNLLQYSHLRLKAFKLFKKAITEDSKFYEKELEQIHREIDEQLMKLN